jgi:hypothetical protein
VTPFVEYAVPVPLLEIATNSPLPYATDDQFDEDGKVPPFDHVIPFVEIIDVVVAVYPPRTNWLKPNATNVPFP